MTTVLRHPVDMMYLKTQSAGLIFAMIIQLSMITVLARLVAGARLEAGLEFAP